MNFSHCSLGICMQSIIQAYERLGFKRKRMLANKKACWASPSCLFTPSDWGPGSSVLWGLGNPAFLLRGHIPTSHARHNRLANARSDIIACMPHNHHLTPPMAPIRLASSKGSVLQLAITSGSVHCNEAYGAVYYWNLRMERWAYLSSINCVHND